MTKKKTPGQLNKEIDRELGADKATGRKRGPSIDYDRWSVELGDAAKRHGARVTYGAATHDAWRKGKSPDEHAAWLAAMAPKKPSPTPPSFDRLTTVSIEYDAAENENERGGGFLPVIRVDGGRRRGHTWAAHGLSRADAEQLALEDAQEEAARYVGDYRVVIRKG